MARPSLRRWFQFSLRTFFVVVAVACLWLGYYARQAALRGQAVGALLNRGAQIIYRHQYIRIPKGTKFLSGPRTIIADGNTFQFNPDAPVPGPDWLRSALGDDFFQEVQVVNKLSCSDDDLRNISVLTTITNLHVGGPRVSDTGFAHVSQLKDLETISLIGTNVTDEGIAGLANLKKLKQIRMWNNSVTPHGVEHLNKSLPNCKIDARGLAVPMKRTN
jgi:hypothetical protein